MTDEELEALLHSVPEGPGIRPPRKAARPVPETSAADLAPLPDYDEVSEFLVPAHARNLRVGLRLEPDALRLLVTVMNHTYGKPRCGYEVRRSAPQLKRLLECGFVEPFVPANMPHWAQQQGPKEYRITEKGALRLLDPESLVCLEVMER